MVSAMYHGPSLGDALIERARRASVRRLILDIAGGLIASAVVAGWRPPGATLWVSAGLCFATFGAWGLAERLLDHPDRVGNKAIAASLLIIRTVAIAVGVAASLLLLFGVLEIAMGTWTS